MTSRRNEIFLIFKILFLIQILSANAADVAIDVGHSINRPGATAASGVQEFVLNRNLTNAIMKNLENDDISYHLIGDDGKMDVLINRTNAAKEDNLFISIHHDSIPLEWMYHVKDYSGYSLFVSRKNAQVNKSLECAKKIGQELLNAGFKPSRYHALQVEGQNRPYADEALGIHYFDDLIVLKTAQQPAILIEAGVIANYEDEKAITNITGQGRLANAIYRGICECVTLK